MNDPDSHRMTDPSYTKLLHFFNYTETKNQWARDDPAFVVLLVTFLTSKGDPL